MEIIMVWRENELAVGALAEQGYYDEETGYLQAEVLAGRVRDLFARRPMKASADGVVEKKSKLLEVGLSKFQLVDEVFPGFRAKHELSSDEAALLKKNPKDHPDLEERDKAIADLTQYLWGTTSKTGRSGPVQALLVQRTLLLIDVKDLKRDGVMTPLKVATDDPDLIIEYYVRPRGDALVKISGGVRDDCTMVGMTFDGITERMKRELGSSVTTAIGRLLQVATPDLAALTAGSDGGKKAIAAGTTKP